MNKTDNFKEEVYTLAFGEDAHIKDYSENEVLSKLQEYTIDSYKYKEAFHILMEYWDSLPDEEKPHIDKKLKELEL